MPLSTAGLPAEALVVLDEGAGREDLAMVAAVDHLVGVRQRDVGRRDAVSARKRTCSSAADPFGAVGQDRARRCRRGRSRRPRTPVARDGHASLPATLMTPARCSSAPIVGAVVVVRVDAIDDVGDEASPASCCAEAVSLHASSA